MLQTCPGGAEGPRQRGPWGFARHSEVHQAWQVMLILYPLVFSAQATADAAAELEGLRLAVSEASATVPALSANAEDYGDAGEMEELERAVSVSYTRRLVGGCAVLRTRFPVMYVKLS